MTEAGIDAQRVARCRTSRATSSRSSGQSFATQGEADAIAQALLDRLANAYLTAEGSCHGNPKIKAGAKLKVSGVGHGLLRHLPRRQGPAPARAAAATRRVFSNSAGEHTLLGAGAGGGDRARRLDSVVIGIVTNNNDPEKLGRVQVKLPALVERPGVWWAPSLVPAAGKERGLSMLPVPDEEVLVAFEHGDPSYPYVLGSLFNGKDTPGDELAVTDGSFAMQERQGGARSPPRRTSRSAAPGQVGDQDQRRHRGDVPSRGATPATSPAPQAQGRAGDHDRVEPVGDDQGAADHGAGAGHAVGRIAGSAVAEGRARSRSKARRW